MTKIALITGATSGIGYSSAIVFAKAGYSLILTGRRSNRLTEMAVDIEAKYGTEIKLLSFDIQNREQVIENLELLSAEWQKVDVLINNAGLSLGLDPIQDGNLNDWDTMIDTNVKGLLYISKIVSNWMIKNTSGHIINIGSIAGKEVYQNGNVYCATKHAVDAINKSMRMDLLPHGIKVSAIHPGAVNTEFSEVRFKGDKDRAKKTYLGFEPLVAYDIAEAILYIASMPAHVNINEMIIMPTAQASAGNILRK